VASRSSMRRKLRMWVNGFMAETSVKHFQFDANWRKLFGELGQIF